MHASQLNLQQAAMLAGLVKNPTGYDPTNYAKRAKDRRDLVINRMKELDVVTATQAAAAIRTQVLDPRRSARTRTAAPTCSTRSTANR